MALWMDSISRSMGLWVDGIGGGMVWWMDWDGWWINSDYFAFDTKIIVTPFREKYKSNI